VAKLKQQPGENILKFGTGELDRTLTRHKLVDEFHSGCSPSPSAAANVSSTESAPHT